MLTGDDLPEKFFRESAGPHNGDHIGTPARHDSKDPDLNLKDLSKQTILKALESCRGNRTEAAKQLGISRRTLHRRLNEFGPRDLCATAPRGSPPPKRPGIMGGTISPPRP